MVPHDAIKGSCGSVEAGKSRPRPCYGVGYTSRAQPVESPLVAMREGVAQFDEIGVVRLVTATALPIPVRTSVLDLLSESADPKAAKVPLHAADVGVPSVDGTPLRGGGNQ